MSNLKPSQLANILGWKAGLFALGITDQNAMSVGLPHPDLTETVVDPLLYGGIYPQAMAIETWAYSALVKDSMQSVALGDPYTFFHSLPWMAMDIAKYKIDQLTFELTTAAYGLANISINGWDIVLSPENIVPNFPAEFAHRNEASAARGQYFNFYFRSLKPSMWRNDLTTGKPKGIVRFQPIIKGLSESYSPKWNRSSILGSVQQHHRYVQTDRSIRLEFTMFADSYQQLQFNIWRLNWLADHCYGRLTNMSEFRERSDDSDTSKFVQNIEFKEFPFMEMTVGTVFVKLPCYIDSMNVTYDMEAPWELGNSYENRLTRWNNLQFPYKIDVSLSLMVLYDKIDPTRSHFYRQYFATKSPEYLKWSENSDHTNPDEDTDSFGLLDLLGDVTNIIPR